MKLSKNVLLALVVGLVLIGVALNGNGDQGQIEASTDSTSVPLATAEVAEVEIGTGRFTDLPIVSTDDLPIEAIETLILIDEGGPYPFDRDDLVFQNREGILPDQPLGHYREYTVITPGESDRGARRVVAGADGERFYTSDHYRSFREIQLPGSG